MANHKPNKPKLSQVPKFYNRPRFESFEAEVEGQGPNFEQVAALKGLTTYERWMRLLKPSAVQTVPGVVQNSLSDPMVDYLWRAWKAGRLDPEIQRALRDSNVDVAVSCVEGNTLRIIRDCCEVGARIQAARGRVHETA